MRLGTLIVGRRVALAVRSLEVDMVGWARRHPVSTYFILAFGLTWLVWVPRAAADQGLLAADWAVAVGRVWTYGPASAALLAAGLAGGRPAVAELGARLVRWRVGWHWYAVVLAGPAALSLTVAGVWVALGGTWAAAAPPALTQGADGGPLPVLTLLLFFVALAVTDGLGEETGWRGFVLPRLLGRHRALPVSLGLGTIWALWHLPLFWTAGAPLEGRSVALQFLALPALSVLYTWVFQHTRGSLLLAVPLHAASNLSGVAVLPPAGQDATPTLLRIGATWLLALGVTLAAASRRSAGERLRAESHSERPRTPGPGE
jgi:membrane protease YdiL (CAAX protease family)